LGVLLAAVDAGLLTLARAIEALTIGPARILGTRAGAEVVVPAPGFVEGAQADLVVVDRSARWTVGPGSLRTKGFGSPWLGRELAGRVLLTVAGGRLAFEDEGFDSGERGEPG
jgi:dihydroorotase